MGRLNRDVYVAVFLLLFSGVMFWASFDIREPDYGVLAPSVWPRVILTFFTILTLIYLVQSLRRGPDEPDANAGEPSTVGGWVSYWRNPIICFVLFDLLGFLFGFLFVFFVLPAIFVLLGLLCFFVLLGLFCFFEGIYIYILYNILRFPNPSWHPPTRFFLINVSFWKAHPCSHSFPKISQT